MPYVQVKAGAAKILNRKIVYESSENRSPLRDDAEFRTRFFDLGVEKIYWLRRLFLCFVSFGRAKEMKKHTKQRIMSSVK